MTFKIILKGPIPSFNRTHTQSFGSFMALLRIGPIIGSVHKVSTVRVAFVGLGYISKYKLRF